MRVEFIGLIVYWICLVKEGEELERMLGFGILGIGIIVLLWRDKKVWRFGGS